MSDGQYRALLREWVDKDAEHPSHPETWNTFAQGIYYLRADYNNLETYGELGKVLSEKDRVRRTAGNRIFYLATAPGDYPGIIRGLGAGGLDREHTEGSGWIRVIIEKPYGRDLESARELSRVAGSVFEEQQV
jgi:glucose-6-phosphate 1-dehydrogenase